MKNVTVTIYVAPESFSTFIGVLNNLVILEVDNDYVFNPEDIHYSDKGEMVESMQVNVPVDLYIKFKYCYEKLSLKK